METAYMTSRLYPLVVASANDPERWADRVLIIAPSSDKKPFHKTQRRHVDRGETRERILEKVSD